jgi:NADH-quinone oxidoreductase subunit E
MSVEHASATPPSGPVVGRTPGQEHRCGYDDATRERLAADAAAIVARYPQARSGLLPMLHLVQAEDGYVSPRGIAFCAETLGISTAEVSAVATFYTQFKRHPNGTYTVGVCTNTLCAIMGGDAIWEELAEHLGIGHDETTPDGAITLERIECNAACDYAPVVMVNWEFFDNQTPQTATALADDLRAGRPAHPTRGADTVATFRETSRVLAGFPDGRADEGVGAGGPTLAGLTLAREHGWHAAPYPDDPTPSSSGSGDDSVVNHDDSVTESGVGEGDGAPAVGGEQSSAQRTPTGGRDVSSDEQERKAASDEAKADESSSDEAKADEAKES